MSAEPSPPPPPPLLPCVTQRRQQPRSAALIQAQYSVVNGRLAEALRRLSDSAGMKSQWRPEVHGCRRGDGGEIWAPLERGNLTDRWSQLPNIVYNIYVPSTPRYARHLLYVCLSGCLSVSLLSNSTLSLSLSVCPLLAPLASLELCYWISCHLSFSLGLFVSFLRLFFIHWVTSIVNVSAHLCPL